MLSPGTTLGGRYRLDERIAGGGMGDVWRGTDEVLGRTVAVKVLLPALLEEPGFAERFRGEARTMATINHPGVVDVYDYGSENGTAFLIMEYVEGDALSRTLSRVNRLTPARTMALVAQAADALHAAHEKGIVHRDVKPGNLLVRPNGTLVLTDFGIARSAMVGQLTAAGSVLGTASYISPEQASGSGATPLSDVYALGVVAYQCLSGHRPFEGENPLEIAMRHVRDNPPPLPGDIPPAVRQIVERAMAKDPAARFPSASAMAQVARRAAAQLSGGGTAMNQLSAGAPSAHGSPIAPVSPVSGGYPVPPVSPAATSGAPMSPATGGLSAGGTRIMPGAAGRPPGQASGPPGNAHAARGAAGVPPPPSRTDTIYNTYGGAGGGGGLAAPPAPSRPGGGPGSGRPKRNQNLVVTAVVLGVLVVLLCGGVGIYLLNKHDKPDTPGSTATSNPPTTAANVDVPCNKLTGQQLDKVRAYLEGEHLTVTTNQVQGAIPNKVTKISPCGSVPVGSTITLNVVKSAGLPTGLPTLPGFPEPDNSGSISPPKSPSARPGNSQQPGGGASASPSCKIPDAPICVGND
jgi:eukaryotic-like serine/threonine-protein kinase